MAIIAGGGTGIGAATAARLAADGAHVMVGDLDEGNAQKVAASLGDRAAGVGFDISDETSVDHLVSAAIAHFGRLDLVHVNAADLSPETIGSDSDVVSMSMQVFDRTIAVNLRGHVLMTRRALPELQAAGGGVIVYTSSAAAFVPSDTRPSYAMSKAALGALVRHVATKWGKEGIRANAVAPGYVVTDKMAKNLDTSTRDYAMSITASTRLGVSSDIASAVAFLMSDEATWVNGQVISVDGGVTMR